MKRSPEGPLKVVDVINSFSSLYSVSSQILRKAAR